MEDKLFIICDCHDLEHQAVFSAHADDEPEWVFISLDFHLYTWNNIFRRIWVAIGYIFGHKSRYGAWDEILINRREAARIRNFMDTFLIDTDIEVNA